MTKYCPFCGEALVDEAKFCKSCGKNLDNVNMESNIGSTGNTQPYSVPIAEKNHTLAIVLGYVFAIFIPLIGLIFGIYLLTRNDSENAKKHGKFVLILTFVIWAISFLLLMN